MAILLGTTGAGATPSRARKWVNTIAKIGSALTSVASSSASPAILTKTAHGLQQGDVVVVTGYTTDTELNTLAVVQFVTVNTFSLKDIGGTAINGASGDTGGSVQRVGIALKPHDLLNMHRTLTQYSYARNSDQADPTYAAESTIQSILSA